MTATEPKIVLDPHSCRFLIPPQGDAAVVQIGKAVYLVRQGVGKGGERWWQFTGSKGNSYMVHVRGPETMHCTCPDQHYRRRTCKHRRCIETLYGVPQVAVAPVKPRCEY